MTPRNPAGSPRSPRSQSSTTSSSSVAAGEVRQSIALTLSAAAQELAEDAGRGAADREVGEEARVVPVGDAREDHALEVGEDAVERLGILRRRRRQGAPDVPRLHPGQHRVALGRREEAGDPVHHLVTVPPELLGIEVAEGSRHRPVASSVCLQSAFVATPASASTPARERPGATAGGEARRTGQDRRRPALGHEVPLGHAPDVLARDGADAREVIVAEAPAAQELVAGQRRRPAEDGILAEEIGRLDLVLGALELLVERRAPCGAAPPRRRARAPPPPRCVRAARSRRR